MKPTTPHPAFAATDTRVIASPAPGDRVIVKGSEQSIPRPLLYG